MKREEEREAKKGRKKGQKDKGFLEPSPLRYKIAGYGVYHHCTQGSGSHLFGRCRITIGFFFSGSATINCGVLNRSKQDRIKHQIQPFENKTNKKKYYKGMF